MLSEADVTETLQEGTRCWATLGAGAMTSTTTLTAALPSDHRERLMRIAHEVCVPTGTRLFEEGRRADRFGSCGPAPSPST